MSNILDNNQPENAGRASASRGQPPPLCVDLNVDPGLDVGLNADAIPKAVIRAAAFRGYLTGRIGVRLTDDATIRELNRRHLGHDYETDVISFGYELDEPLIEGELVASVETATRRAGQLGWPATSELLLYVVHGTLHISGMDDVEAVDRGQMRLAEREILMQLGVDQIERFGADDFSGEPAEDVAEDVPEES